MTGGPAAAILGLPKLPPGLPREVTIQFVAALIARCCVIATLVAGLPAGCRAQAHRGHQDAAEMGAMDSTDQHVTGAAHDAMSGPLGADSHMLLTPPPARESYGLGARGRSGAHHARGTRKLSRRLPRRVGRIPAVSSRCEAARLPLHQLALGHGRDVPLRSCEADLPVGSLTRGRRMRAGGRDARPNGPRAS